VVSMEAVADLVRDVAVERIRLRSLPTAS
jgi:hypothetical protein